MAAVSATDESGEGAATAGATPAIPIPTVIARNEASIDFQRFDTPDSCSIRIFIFPITVVKQGDRYPSDSLKSGFPRCGRRESNKGQMGLAGKNVSRSEEDCCTESSVANNSQISRYSQARILQDRILLFIVIDTFMLIQKYDSSDFFNHPLKFSSKNRVDMVLFRIFLFRRRT